MTTAHQLAETVKIALADYQKVVKVTVGNTEAEQQKFEFAVLKLILEGFAAKAEALEAQAA